MNMKRIIAVGAVCALLTGALTVGASAHGGHGRRACRSTYPTCTVENCHRTGSHTHNGTTYCSPTVQRSHHGGHHH